MNDMQQLPPALLKQLDELAAEGNDEASQGNFHGAAARWEAALGILPEPAEQWDAWLWLKASIGDVLYHAGDFPNASATLQEALAHPEGGNNPFVHYMLGKTLAHLHDDAASGHLLQAYQLDGNAIFEADENEGAAALALLRARHEID